MSDEYDPSKAGFRYTDPETSRKAAKEVEADGTGGRQRAIATALVFAHPGLPAGELSLLGSLSRHDLSRRLPEAEAAGSLHRGPSRKDVTTNKTCMTWWPGAVDEPPDEPPIEPKQPSLFE